MSSISFLLPNYRERVLGLLLLHPQRRYHVREIARLTHTTAGSLHRELFKLAEAQVLLREMEGKQVYYQANTSFLIFNELASILRKTSGLINILADALAPIANKIEVAFVFGSIANRTENPNSDVDVLIIGEVSFNEAAKSLYATQDVIGREINPKVYNKSEWRKLIKSKNSFAREILNKPKLFIIGNISDIE
jgi:predicted nucleotidyltransferase